MALRVTAKSTDVRIEPIQVANFGNGAFEVVGAANEIPAHHRAQNWAGCLFPVPRLDTTAPRQPLPRALESASRDTRQNGCAGQTKDQHEMTRFTTPLNLQNLHPRFKSWRRLEIPRTVLPAPPAPVRAATVAKPLPARSRVSLYALGCRLHPGGQKASLFLRLRLQLHRPPDDELRPERTPETQRLGRDRRDVNAR